MEAEMAAQPEIVQRSEQPYVGIRALVTMQTIGQVLPGLCPEVAGWLSAQGVHPAGPPFFKFNVIDMERQLEVEAGFPVAAPLTGDDRVLAGIVPPGRYATLRHTGHPEELITATSRLLDWAAQQGLAFDVEDTSEGQRWAARLEIYQADPPPDMNAWETELAFKLAD
jgi:effector-binding domain-containing protein